MTNETQNATQSAGDILTTIKSPPDWTSASRDRATESVGVSGSGTKEALVVRDLCKRYETDGGALNVLDRASLTLAPGDAVALTGESGSGKSTLLHLIAGLDAHDAGDIIIAGRALEGLNDEERARMRREEIGVVFQQFNLIPSLPVFDNIAFQARIADRFDAAWTNTLVDRLGLGALTRRYPEQLSGGQQQRVAVARALAGKPTLILADEPTGNLDEETSDSVLALTLDLVADSGAALLMVTHSERLAGRLRRRLHLSGGKLQ
ncbi:MAG: ABC transporter ATP-binding protein [Pseudomonadota bacterium]